MRKGRQVGSWLICGIIALWALIPFAVWAFDAIVIIDGVAGGNTTPGREDSSVIESFSFTNSNAGDQHVGGGAGGGSPSFSDVSVVKIMDKASPILAQACASGAVFPKVEIHVFSTDPKAAPFYQVVMEDVIISSVNPTGGLTETRESVSFNYAKVKWTYEEAGASPVEGGWDIVNGVPQ